MGGGTGGDAGVKPTRSPGGNHYPAPVLPQPGATTTTQAGRPGATPRPPMAVGGSITGVGGSGAGSAIRTIYGRPETTATRPAAPVSRPITGSDVDSRQAGKLSPRPNVVAPRPGSVTPGPRSTAAPVAGHRYNTAPISGPTKATGPTLSPRTKPAPVATAPRVTAPRLNPRPVSSGLLGRNLGRNLVCADPLVDLCWSTTSSLCFGLGSGSFCWTFGAPSCYSTWWPGMYHGYGWYDCTWNWWYPRHLRYSYWWWPSYCYLPTYLYYPVYPSTVVVVEGAGGSAGGEVVVAGGATGSSVATEATPQQLAQKFVALGDFYFRENRFAEAADAYARARTYAPHDASLHFVLADAAFATGDYHFAAFLIGEALRLDPTMAHAVADKRRFYSDPAVFAAQMKTLQDYLKDKPYDAMAWLVLGYNLKFSEQADAAARAFRRVLEIDPAHEAATLFLAALEPGSVPAPAPADEVEATAEPAPALPTGKDG